MKQRDKFIFELENSNDKRMVMVSYEVYSVTAKKNVYWFKNLLLEELVSELESNNEFFYHEMIFGDKPCRLFLDCDGPELSIDDEEIFITEIKNRVRSLFLETFFTSVGEPMIIAANRKGKSSFHVIWDVWFERAMMLENMIKKWFPEPIMGMNIDKMVYPKIRTPQTLRLPYCLKLVEKVGKYPCLPWKNSSSLFSRDIFIKACLTYTSEQCEGFSTPSTLYSWVIDDPKTKFIESPTSSDERNLRIVIGWFELMYKCVQINQWSVREDGSFSFRCRMFCPIANRVHKSNGIFVFATKFGSLHHICMDEECDKIRVDYECTVFDLVMGSTTREEKEQRVCMGE